MTTAPGPARRGAATIPGLLAETVRRDGARPAVVDGDRELSWQELLDEAGRFFAALVASGVESGERVAVWAFNSAEWIVAALGTWTAGAVLVPVNTRFKGVEAADILLRSRARVLVTVSDFLGTDYLAMLDATGIALPDLAEVVVARGRPGGRAIGWEAWLARATPGAGAAVRRRVGAIRPDDPSDILFTSGTTGVPKGVVMTHSRTLAVATDWVAMTGLRTGDRYLMVNPYFHMFGLKAGILASVAAGAVMLPEPVFDAGRVLNRVDAEGVTVLPGAPTVYQSLLDHPGRDRFDLASLRVAVTGAADIPVELIRRVQQELPFSVVVTGYGLTEAGTACATGPDDDAEAVATTVGRPRPGFELRLVDPQGATVPAGDTGEVLLRGPSVMAGYLDDPQSTAAVLSPDGWLHTGDLGALDPLGRLRIVGRVKDMFIVGGFNAYPAEIENTLLRHPQIRAAAVIGVPDRRLGEVGAAFVVLHPGATATGEDIVSWCREQMANYKVPRVVEVVDALPMNATGKVLKDELRVRAAGPVEGTANAGPRSDAAEGSRVDADDGSEPDR